MSEPPAASPATPGSPGAPSAADLAHLVVDSAAERQLAADSTPEILLPEDLLPGVGEEQTSLKEGLRTSGSRAFIVLAIIVTLDNLQSSGLAVLAPNIQSSFHVSTGAIIFVAGIVGRLPGPGHRADGMVGRPFPACAHHRVGHLRVRR